MTEAAIGEDYKVRSEWTKKKKTRTAYMKAWIGSLQGIGS